MMLWVLLLSMAWAMDPELRQSASEVTMGYAACQAAERGPAAEAVPVCEAALLSVRKLMDLLAAHPEWSESETMSSKVVVYETILVRAVRHLKARATDEATEARRREAEREYEAAYAAAAARAGVPITNEGGGVVSRIELTKEQIQIIDKVFFETGSAEIDPRWDPLLDEVAMVINDHPDIGTVEVVGHSDSTGDALGNLELSQARAQAVVDALVAAGASPLDLKVMGYGEDQPIATNSTPEGRERNRRVEFRLTDEAVPLFPDVPELGADKPPIPVPR